MIIWVFDKRRWYTDAVHQLLLNRKIKINGATGSRLFNHEVARKLYQKPDFSVPVSTNPETAVNFQFTSLRCPNVRFGSVAQRVSDSAQRCVLYITMAGQSL
jgi:hypothetical protein